MLLLWDSEDPKPGERMTKADLAAWPSAARAVYRHRKPLLPQLENERVEALVGPSLYDVLRASGHEKELAAIRCAGIGLYSFGLLHGDCKQ